MLLGRYLELKRKERLGNMKEVGTGDWEINIDYRLDGGALMVGYDNGMKEYERGISV
jgi:hypothetical protein